MSQDSYVEYMRSQGLVPWWEKPSVPHNHDQCEKCGGPATFNKAGQLKSSVCDDCMYGPKVNGRYRTVDDSGYVRVRIDGQWRAEHRVVMEEALGRPLVKGESVHHKNGIRSDNDPANLELWVGPIRSGARATDVTCPNCGCSYYDVAVGK